MRREQLDGDSRDLDFPTVDPTGDFVVVTDLRRGEIVILLAGPLHEEFGLPMADIEPSRAAAVAWDLQTLDVQTGSTHAQLGRGIVLQLSVDRTRDDEFAELFEACAVQLPGTVEALRLGPFWAS